MIIWTLYFITYMQCPLEDFVVYFLKFLFDSRFRDEAGPRFWAFHTPHQSTFELGQATTTFHHESRHFSPAKKKKKTRQTLTETTPESPPVTAGNLADLRRQPPRTPALAPNARAVNEVRFLIRLHPDSSRPPPSPSSLKCSANLPP